MIKSNELRIGNLVEQIVYTDAGKYSVITGIGLITQDDVDVNPISLTPETLEKAGIFYPYFKITQSNKDGSVWWIDVGWVVYIEYVHQLQNLYFALTGEELTIEL